VKSAVFVAAVACLSAPLAAETPINAPDDVAAIRAFEQQNAEQMDPAVLGQAFAPDAVILDYMTGGVYHGRAEIQKGMAAQIAPLKSVSAKILEQSTLTDGDFACTMLTTNYQVVMHDGSKASMTLRQMDALRKIGGKWQVLQEQVAVPQDTKTGLALLDDQQVRGDIVWPASTASSQTVPEAQALKEIETWTNVSLRVVGIDAILPYYGPGETEIAVYAPTAPGNVRGKTEMRAYYAPSMNSFTSVDTKTPVLKIASNGRIGAQVDIQEIVLHLKNGKTQSLYWRQSDCVHRVGGKWYGVLNMSSFPVDLKTGKSDSKWSDFPVGTVAAAQP
jgi:ketosteroid isomerase-like protein